VGGEGENGNESEIRYELNNKQKKTSLHQFLFYK